MPIRIYITLNEYYYVYHKETDEQAFRLQDGELPDGNKQFGKTINNDPETYFTDEVMEKLDEAAKMEFSYG